MNQFRNLLLVSGILLIGVANAQSYQLKAGAGATLNGNMFRVADTGSFTIEVWMNTGAAATDISSFNVALAFGKAVGSGASGTPDSSNKLQFQNATYHGVGLDAFDTQLGTAFEVRAAASIVGSNSNYGSNPYPIIVNLQRGARTQQNIANGSYKIASYTFNHSLAAGGDTAIGALFAADQGGNTSQAPQNGSSGYSRSRFGSMKYSVQTAPEPGTMFALVAGLSAIAARRRNKK